jgi:hypothetical protein
LIQRNAALARRCEKRTLLEDPMPKVCEFAFIALPQIPPRNVNWAGEGYWVHMAKVAFEKYFLRKVRRGSSEPAHERIVMKALGIAKLRQQAPPATAAE